MTWTWHVHITLPDDCAIYLVQWLSAQSMGDGKAGFMSNTKLVVSRSEAEAIGTVSMHRDRTMPDWDHMSTKALLLSDMLIDLDDSSRTPVKDDS